jgi:hypothetical protein
MRIVSERTIFDEICFDDNEFIDLLIIVMSSCGALPYQWVESSGSVRIIQTITRVEIMPTNKPHERRIGLKYSGSLKSMTSQISRD